MLAIVGVWFRYGLLRVARVVGGAYRLLLAARYWLVTAAGVVVGVLWVLDRGGVDGGKVLRGVGVLVVLGLGAWVLRSRRRLVIANFVDYTGAEPKVVPGMSTLLQLELARLYELIRVVDEERAVPDAVRGPQNVSFAEDKSLSEAEDDPNLITSEPLDVPAPIRVEDLGHVLEAAVSIEATMTLGPVTIPIGALASLIGRLAQGPRVVGSIHRTGDTLVVSARSVGDKVGHVWRVDSTVGTNGRRAVRPEDLLDELAVRLLTDLAPGGSVKWKATNAYVNGLRAYRDCLRTKKDRRLRLEKAKDSFVQAIAEDERFHLAHYNLGVVATELQQWSAAEAAFLAAIERDADRWDPYYGLAQLYFVRCRYDEMLPLCGRMVELHEHKAESHHLRALANRRTGNVAGALADRRAAVWWAWGRLCRAAFKGATTRAAKVAATSLRNVAGIRAYRAKDRPGSDDDASDSEGRPPLRLTAAYMVAGAQLRQGIWLAPSDAELHFELGKVYAARRKWELAIRHLERAVQIVPDRPRFWVQLARAYAGPLCARSGLRHADARAQRRRQAAAAANRAFEQPSKLVDSGFTRLAAVYQTLATSGAGPRETDRYLARLAEVRRVQAFEARRRRWDERRPSDEELAAELEPPNGEGAWQSTQVYLEMARRHRRQVGGDPEEARRVAGSIADRLLGVLDDFRRAHPQELQRLEVHAVVAQLLLAAGRAPEALRQADIAVLHNPLSYEARTALAEVQLSLGNMAQAEAARRGALVCEPDRAYGNFRLGETLVRAALECHAPDRRRSLLDEAKQHFATTLALLDLGGTAAETDAEERVTAVSTGQVAFWLGRAHFDSDEYQEAITQLQLAILLGYQKPLARLRLGVAYIRMGHFCEGEKEFELVLREAGPPQEEIDRRTLGPPGDVLSWHEICTWAQIYSAASRIERDAGVKKAIATIEQVAADLDGVDERSRPSFRAVCADWEGWGWFGLGHVDRAIERVSASVELEPTADAYLHLAQLYARRALDGEDPARRRADHERARRTADLARRIGLGREQQKPLDAALRRLDLEFEGHPAR